MYTIPHEVPVVLVTNWVGVHHPHVDGKDGVGPGGVGIHRRRRGHPVNREVMLRGQTSQNYFTLIFFLKITEKAV